MNFIQSKLLNLKFTLFFLICSAIYPLSAKGIGTISVSIDLIHVKNDQVKVVIIPPAILTENISYIMPASVPGTYEKDDYGRFIAEISAFDANGKPLKIERVGNNETLIHDAKHLARLEYWVNDSWDDSDTSYREVFQPAGSNFEEGKNFVLNHHAMIGYFEGFKALPYNVTVKKPTEMFAATSLNVLHESDSMDILSAPNYAFLVDNPTMYSKPDTVSFVKNNSRIMVAVYSATGVVKAETVVKAIKPLADAAEKFFGGMPVDKYTFIFYFYSHGQQSVGEIRGAGALEHSYSSFYFLPEIKDTHQLFGELNGTAHHEFLHIFIPLHLHSELIDDFDFRNPKMSKHLWLYEGTTEYFAMLTQIQGGLDDSIHFRNNVQRKIIASGFFDKMFGHAPFATMSERVFEPKYQAMYPIIYEKGAITAMMLDLRLLDLSGGKMGLHDLTKKLADIYGIGKPFPENELFEIIVKMTYPEIRQFFDDYILDEKPLPLTEYFDKMGWKYSDSVKVMSLSFGTTSLASRGGKLYFDDISDSLKKGNLNNSLNLMIGDSLLSINGMLITRENRWKLAKKIQEPLDSSEVTVIIERDGKEVILKGRPALKEKTKRNILEEMPSVSAKQIAIRRKIEEGN